MKAKAEKEAVVSELKEKFSKAKAAFLTEYSGIGVLELSTLRDQLRKTRTEFRVVKNTLARRAAEGTSLAVIASRFEGPTAIALGYQDPVEAAKVLRTFSENQQKLKLRAAVVEGQLLGEDGLKALAALPSRPILLTRFAGQIGAPLYGLVGSLQGVLRNMVGILQAVEKHRREETPPSGS